MNAAEVHSIINYDINVIHRPHSWFEMSTSGELWIQYVVPGIPHHVKGRKWRISKYATKSEVVQTALLAVIQFEEHEVREGFLYKDKPIFQSHYDVDLLADNLTPTERRA